MASAILNGSATRGKGDMEPNRLTPLTQIVPSVCEWCRQTTPEGALYYHDFSQRGWFGMKLGQRHFGYFCSPKCCVEAVEKGITGTPHPGNDWFVDAKRAFHDWAKQQ